MQYTLSSKHQIPKYKRYKTLNRKLLIHHREKLKGGLNRISTTSYDIQVHLILLHLTLLYFADIAFF